MIYIGIDPGASGAAVAITDEAIYSLRFAKFTDHEIADWFVKYGWSERCHAVLEKVHAGPKGGSSAMFKYGQRFGFIQGVLTAIKVPHDLVPPQQWQKVFGLIMKGVKFGASEKKRHNRAAAERLFPNIKMTADLADALLLAEYCRRTHRRDER